MLIFGLRVAARISADNVTGGRERLAPMAGKSTSQETTSGNERFRRTGKLTIFIVFVFACVLPLPLIAQPAPDIAGNWQGTVDAGRGFQVILQISQTNPSQPGKNAWQGVFFTMGPDGTRETDLDSFTLEGMTLRFAIHSGGSFQGKLGAGGKSIVGTLQEGTASYAVTLARATADTEWVVPKPTDHMPPDAKPEFEVATVKPTDPGKTRRGFESEGRKIFCENETVDDMISFAYGGIHKRQILDGPPWLATDKFDVEGMPDLVGEPDLKQMQSMYRSLLASRFNLVLHHESREIPVYSLQIAKSGAKLARSLGDPKGLPDSTFTEWNSQAITFRGTNASMLDLTWALDFVLDRPVVDQSALGGKFDFSLRWAPDTARPEDPNTPPPLFTAIQEQLGLRLEATKAQADVLVVDHVDRPSPN